MPYTSRDGTEHPESFWCFDGLRVDPSDTALIVTFRGWRDVAAYDADKSPIAEAMREVRISGAGYYALIGQGAPIGTIAEAMVQMAWDAMAEDQFFSEAV